MAITSILVLLCAIASSQGRHFLIETEDNKGESAEETDDYASDAKPLTAKEEGAIIDAFDSLKKGAQIKETYNGLNSTMKDYFHKKIRSAYGEDLDAMVQGAKNGDIVKILKSDEECIIICSLSALAAALVPALTVGAKAAGLAAATAAGAETVKAIANGCFSSSSTVQTPSGVIAIQNLRLNDSVLTFTPGVGAHYTEMLGWLDRSTATPNKFLEVYTSNSGFITLSASHVIFRFSKTSGALESLYAGQLAVGDQLVQLKDGGSEDIVQAVEVLLIKEVWDSGYWAPLTSSGTLLVDGFLASCYASFPHDFSQVGFAPVKMFPRLLLDDEASQHKDGVREVVKMMKKAGETLGLRRKVEKCDGNNLEKPSFADNALNILAAGFEKHAEL